MSLEDYADPFYRELIPTRPTPAVDTLSGPTEMWRRLEVEREKWLAVREVADEAEAVA